VEKGGPKKKLGGFSDIARNTTCNPRDRKKASCSPKQRLLLSEKPRDNEKRRESGTRSRKAAYSRVGRESEKSALVSAQQGIVNSKERQSGAYGGEEVKGGLTAP